MTQRTCSIDECDRPVRSRGWCNMHYKRWLAHGDPNVTLRVFSAAESFALRAQREGECLIWTGALDTYGYGTIIDQGRCRLVHRYAWEQANGPILDGAEIDHYVCFNRACCEIAHLRLVNHKQNGENRSGAYKNNRSSGVRGVSWHKGKRRWQVYVTHESKRIHGGSFATLAEAEIAARELRNSRFTHNEKDRRLGLVAPGK